MMKVMLSILPIPPYLSLSLYLSPSHVSPWLCLGSASKLMEKQAERFLFSLIHVASVSLFIVYHKGYWRILDAFFSLVTDIYIDDVVDGGGNMVMPLIKAESTAVLYSGYGETTFFG
jgi:hypothetical protein